jgi:[CysO sulfur-carrier protein]-S-L-cysteine hydrolase
VSTDGFAGPALRLTRAQHRQMIAHCYDGLDNEACGLLGGLVVDGEPTGVVTRVYPCANEDASARSYTVHSRDMIRALRDAEANGGELVGVFHSHTHTDAYPSETDVAQAFEPGWLYVIVSLKADAPAVRAYRIRDGSIAEVPVVLDE